MTNYTKQQPTRYTLPPSEYFGNKVRVILGKHKGKTGLVTVHYTDTGVIRVMAELEDFYTHVNNVTIIEVQA